MSIQAGLVGLPNVGKSTLFNALTKSSVPAENYPFCTIDPHAAITEVPDPRLDKLAQIYHSAKTIPSTVTFVDIAGLVKGAAAGQGLGNQFLSHIREVDLILHVLRCFEDSNIVHTSTEIDPIADYEVIMAELMLKDLESVDKRLEKLEKLVRVTQQAPELKKMVDELELLRKVKSALNAGNDAEVKKLMQDSSAQTIPLLSAKNFLIIANVSEQEAAPGLAHQNKYVQQLINRFGEHRVIPICAKIENDLSQLNDSDAAEFMHLFGMTYRGLDVIIRAAYEYLNLITFFTCGPKEAHAWPVLKGISVRAAAGEIHSDLERGFICAEVFNCADLFACGSETKIKERGLVRTEGQNYIVQDGDLLNIKFNV